MLPFLKGITNKISNLNLTGAPKTGSIQHLQSIKKVSSCHLGSIYQKLSEKVSPDFIQESGSICSYTKATPLKDTLLYPFTKMPKEILNSFANRFHIESLQNSKMLIDFNNANKNEAYERAMRGFITNCDNYIVEFAKERLPKGTKIKPQDIEDFICENGCNKDFQEICEKVTDKFFKQLDQTLEYGNSKYNTTHERTIVRLVSGITAAIMLGSDFYNKSLMNGKTDEEAEKAASGKRKQEIIATAEEALSQYFMLGAFSSFTNNSTFGAPLINTGLGLMFHITSRTSTGKPLTRIKLPEKLSNFITIEKFQEAVKNNNVHQAVIQPELQEKEEKNHILSFKNIALFCLASVGAGFAIRGLKNGKIFENLKKNKIYKNLKNNIENIKLVKDIEIKIKNIKDGIKNFTTGRLEVSKDELKNFYNTLSNTGLEDIRQYFQNEKLKNAFDNPKLLNKDGKIFIGEYEKMSKIPFTNIEISNKELLMIPLAPFRIAKEIIFYPYKLVSAALEGLGVIKKTDPPKLKNEYNLVNLYRDFQMRAEKFNGKTDTDEFLDRYEQHIKSSILSTLNKETKSNVDNCNIGKLTALLGVFSSIYFATTDDYNNTLSQTGDKERANKDARLRGVNKIIRTSVQCVFLSLNNLFKVIYGKSILGAAAITAACTILTDSTSRVLSGMPFKKMNKEELEKYNKEKKEGALKKYYNALDKLTD